MSETACTSEQSDRSLPYTHTQYNSKWQSRPKPLYIWPYLVAVHEYVCFVALRPKSTAMVIAGWSVHLTTLFPGQA